MIDTEPADVIFGPAERSDLGAIVELLTDDLLGRAREASDLAPYGRAFDAIIADPNNHLLVGRLQARLVATLQLTVIPCMSHGGTMRGQLESVRVHETLRSRGIGERLCRHAIDLAQELGCGIIQLTSDHRRTEARRFYERLGFSVTHHGMKLDLRQ